MIPIQTRIPSGEQHMFLDETLDSIVNKPSHYLTDTIECIDAIEAALGPQGFQAYCRGCVLKYAWRATKKNSAKEDLAKAAWYASKASEKA